MNNVVALDARCLTCGYSLHGLSQRSCPECGRAFDPGDPRSFDTLARRTKRRRRRVFAGLSSVLLLIGVAPRGMYRSDINFTCAVCGRNLTEHRWELAPPRWIPFRYPSWTWQKDTSTQKGSPCASCAWAIRVSAESPNCKLTGTLRLNPGEEGEINERPATPDTARDVLKALSAPTNYGISLGPKPRMAPTP